MKKANFAVIGCGRISQTYLEVCKSLELMKLIAVVDINEEVAKSVSEEFNCKYYTDYSKLLKDERLDAVIICTPPSTHSKIAIQALTEGINVFCEKPFSINSKEAKGMVEAADEKNKLLMMASKFRFVDDIIKTKGMIESGMLGDIILFKNSFCSCVDMRHRWNSKKDISGGGILMDNGPHSVDIARFLIGPIAAVQLKLGRQIQNIEVEDTCELSFKSSTGIIGTIDLSWSISKNEEYYINVYGTEGNINVGWHVAKYSKDSKSSEFVFGNGYDKFTAFRKQLLHFINCLHMKEKPIINNKDAVESVKVIEAAYRYRHLNKLIKIDAD